MPQNDLDTKIQALAVANGDINKKIINGLDTIDSGVVHNTGNETITGDKTFTGYISFKDHISKFHPDIKKGTNPSSSKFYPIYFFEKDNNAIPGSLIGVFETSVGTDGAVSTYMKSYKYVANGSDQVAVGIIYPLSGSPYLCSFSNNSVLLGTSSYKWKEIWCGQNSLNSSSDERLKDEISSYSDDILDAWEEVEFKTFKFKDAIQEKGSDNARIHSGLVAQHIDSIFKKHNLNANDYGFFLYDTWKATPEEKDENGNVIHEAQPAGDSYGLRYTEALCIEAAYNRRKVKQLESEIELLKKEINLLKDMIKNK